MPIFYNQETKTFTINTENSTYAMYVAPYDLLTHIYYGDKVSDSVSLNYLETRCGPGRNLAPSETVAIFQDFLNIQPSELAITELLLLSENLQMVAALLI